MKLHELKIKHKYLIDIESGIKTFEIRKNDRDYQVGDLVHFIDVQDFELNLYKLLVLYNANALYRIVYVLKDIPEYGLDKDYCIFGIKEIREKENDK